MTQDRRQAAYEFRVSAAEAARDRIHPAHEANGDEQRYAGDRYGMSFTKGLEHNAATGLIERKGDFEAFRSAIDNGYIDAFTEKVPVPTANPRRKWEAPTAGLVYELEGPDPQAVTMAPAPALGSEELDFEMAEVYELALLRDVSFSGFLDPNQVPGQTNVPAVDQAAARLRRLPYARAGYPNRPRVTKPNGRIEDQTVFRGSSPGVEVGPYLSQFMLIGNATRTGDPVSAGLIEYGAITVDQRVAVAPANTDYMQTAADWLSVQNGYEQPKETFSGRRFMSTPRDLATYVHFDALYEAYLNACLILLGMNAPADPGFDALSGGGMHVTGGGTMLDRNAGGFALYGGPHILTLVTEVATRALKAVRYQKFNNHIRLRPEALAGRLQHEPQISADFPALGGRLQTMAAEIDDTLTAVRNFNPGNTAYLPMAFPEGSPMHPAYGAGHATVAGACVTVLKAFFDTSAVFVKPGGAGEPTFKTWEAGDAACAFISNFGLNGGTGDALEEFSNPGLLTLEGELNKLAANISIGRNMAGVHYFSDYYDSLRMGEEIAIGMLEEQALGYATDPFVMSLTTFDGEVRRIGAR